MFLLFVRYLHGIATHPRTTSRLSMSCGFRGAGPSIRNPLQAPKERSCGISTHHHPLVPRSGTDYHPKHHTGCISPPSGNYMGWRCRTYPQLRCFAACSGFHDIGPASRNPLLILNLLVVRGCVATAGRHSLLGLHSLLIYKFML